MSEEKRKGGSARAALGRSGRGENIKRSLGRGGVSPLEGREYPESNDPQEASHTGQMVEEQGSTKPRTKRITVDLPISEHRFLRDYAYDHDADGMKVVRALLAELAEDPELGSRIQARLAGK
ncbi:hypothetical protein [Rubrobacter aplysinae]|uniref:hypothetical protein n=1 Tax=Rubrobacter aplysinae TaxID=909625 RepID=UPI00064C0123|nr:hypothetical protein [Rubrobacter aplysinae]